MKALQIVMTWVKMSSSISDIERIIKLMWNMTEIMLLIYLLRLSIWALALLKKSKRFSKELN